MKINGPWNNFSTLQNFLKYLGNMNAYSQMRRNNSSFKATRFSLTANKTITFYFGLVWFRIFINDHDKQCYKMVNYRYFSSYFWFFLTPSNRHISGFALDWVFFSFLKTVWIQICMVRFDWNNFRSLHHYSLKLDLIIITNRVTLNIKNPRICMSYHNLSIF